MTRTNLNTQSRQNDIKGQVIIEETMIIKKELRNQNTNAPTLELIAQLQ